MNHVVETIPGLSEQAVVFSAADVRHALTRTAPHLNQWLMDTKYRALPEQAWAELVKQHGLIKRRYTPEYFDCDDFATVFQGRCADYYAVNGCGKVVDFSGRHSYNILLVVEEGQVLRAHLYEPQNEGRPTPGQGHYTERNGFIII